ncbi:MULTISPECIES: hypothetical protein [Pirellulaceae]|nr:MULTISPECIES: hypothetical protein [Pirellulaceae]
MLVALALAQVYSNSWRQIAREYGVYEARRPAQRMATAAVVGVVPLLGVLGGLWASGWRFPAATAMAVTFLLLAFAIVKVISYHPIDAILQVEAIHGVTLFGVVFAVGIFALNICLFQCIEDDLGA